MKTWKNISPFWKTQIVFVVILLTGIVFTTKVDKASNEAWKAETAALAVEVNAKYHQVDGTVEAVQVLPGDVRHAFSSGEQTLLWYANAKVRLADGKAYIVRLPSDSKALVGNTVKVWVGPNGVLETTPLAVSNLERRGRGSNSFLVILFLGAFVVTWPLSSMAAWEDGAEYHDRYRRSRREGLTRKEARRIAALWSN